MAVALAKKPSLNARRGTTNATSSSYPLRLCVRTAPVLVLVVVGAFVASIWSNVRTETSPPSPKVRQPQVRINRLAKERVRGQTNSIKVTAPTPPSPQVGRPQVGINNLAKERILDRPDARKSATTKDDDDEDDNDDGDDDDDDDDETALNDADDDEDGDEDGKEVKLALKEAIVSLTETLANIATTKDDDDDDDDDEDDDDDDDDDDNDEKKKALNHADDDEDGDEDAEKAAQEKANRRGHPQVGRAKVGMKSLAKERIQHRVNARKSEREAALKEASDKKDGPKGG